MQLVALAFSLLWCELGIPGLGAHCSLCTSDILRINPSPQHNSLCCAAAYMCTCVEVSNLFQCQDDMSVGFSNGLMEWAASNLAQSLATRSEGLKGPIFFRSLRHRTHRTMHHRHWIQLPDSWAALCGMCSDCFGSVWLCFKFLMFSRVCFLRTFVDLCVTYNNLYLFCGFYTSQTCPSS